jgi:UDP:flavonoid glycosyltransferase YjiC (YdhE family)
MSSTLQNQGGRLQRVIDGLATLPVRALVTTGPALDPNAFRGSSNAVVLVSAPHSEVLKDASVVVIHGGHGTVVRALAAGVPMIVMPQGRDQADDAARVTSRRAGITINKNARPAAVAAAVRRVLDDPRYRQAAQRLGRSIRADAQSGAMFTELEDLRSGA